MKKYSVSLPFSGYVYVDVEAESEKDAINNALESAQMRCFAEGNTEIVEWDFFKNIVQGNVCYAPCSQAEATEQDDD